MLSWPRPAARWPQPDFIARPPRAPLLAWLLLVVGALAAAVALDDWLALSQRREDTARELDRLQALRSPAAVRPPVRAAAPAVVVAAHEVARHLQHPWREVLQAVERQAAPGVQWLRMEHDTARGELRLTGVADRRDDVTATLESLSRVPALRDLMLIRIESPDTPILTPSASTPPTAQPASGGAALRFEISLRVAGVGSSAAGAP